MDIISGWEFMPDELTYEINTVTSKDYLDDINFCYQFYVNNGYLIFKEGSVPKIHYSYLVSPVNFCMKVNINSIHHPIYISGLNTGLYFLKIDNSISAKFFKP